MPQNIISQFRREYNSPIETDRQVNNINARDAINILTRWEGMNVYVISEGITYSLVGGLDNTNWVEVAGIGEAPIDGQAYIRKDEGWELMPSPTGFVDLTTDQSIGGVKTFTSRVSQTGLGGSTFFGENAGLNDDGTDNFNSAFGYDAFKNNTTGVSNVAVGYQALLTGTIANTNVAIGALSLQNYVSGQSNVGIGFGSFINLTGGDFNIAVGANAGRYIGDDSVPVTNSISSIFLGAGSRPLGDSEVNQIVIGRDAKGGGSNTITLGNSSITALRCQVTSITALSDSRDKENISPIKSALNTLSTLNPITFEWNQRDGGKVGKKATGFLAQELLETQNNSEIGEYLDLVDETNPDRLEARYGHLIPLMVKAIQELNDIICPKN